MSYIGNTFSTAVTEILAFSVVMVALLLAFSSFFNILLASNMTDFGSFLGSVEVMTLMGLVGAIDSLAISVHLPTLGPIFYGAYLMCVLFVGFTILISIITDKYADAKEIKTKEGFVVLAYHKLEKYYNRIFPDPDKLHSDDDADDDADSGDGSGSSEDKPGPATLVEDLQSAVAQQNKLLISLTEHVAMLEKKLQSSTPTTTTIHAADFQTNPAAVVRAAAVSPRSNTEPNMRFGRPQHQGNSNEDNSPHSARPARNSKDSAVVEPVVEL